MKKYLFACVLFGTMVSFNHLDSTAQNLSFLSPSPNGHGGYTTSQGTSLESVLNAIQSKINVSFNYNSSLVKGKVVKAKLNNLNLENLSQFLYSLLHPLGLSAERINDNQFVIRQEAIKEPVIQQEAAQEVPSHEVTGLVTSETNAPLAGVTVTVKGSESNGTITDGNGKYSLSVAHGTDTLVFSYLGYITNEIAIANQDVVNVSLKPNQSKLNEVVVVGYGTQKRETVTGSISSVEGKQLTVTPIASTANALAGRLPGLVSLQSSGQPGADASSLSIRGFGNALVIVDGIESSFNNIDANEIASITVLKDGAASIYGARAGNGVILVTTKRGEVGKPSITLNSSYTLQGITEMPKPASSGQYAEMKREAWLQSGQPEATAPFTTDQIQKYYDGTDPLYPNTDWYNVLIRKWAPQQQHNLSVRGGSERIKYYGFLGYLDQQTIWKNHGGDYKRYNIQSNIDAKILDNLSLQLDISAITEEREFPWRGDGTGANTVWQDFWNTLPIYPATLPDPTKISFANGGGTGGAHVSANSAISGYDRTESQDLRGTISLNYSFPAIEGLTAKALVNVLQGSSINKHFTRPVQFYTYDPTSKTYTLAGSLGSTASMSTNNSQNRTITGQFMLHYDHTFAKYHHITALGLYESIDYSSQYVSAGRINFLTPAIDQLYAGSTSGMTNNGSASEMGRKSYVGRINYDYKGKYLVETILRADASAKFPPEKRWGYFPSVSLGWVLSEENFMKNSSILDNLKIRGSYGKSGNDAVGNFQYLSGYQYGHTFILDDNVQQGIVSTGLANPNLTWEKINIYNVGVDFSLWNRKLYGVADVFYRERSGIPATRITTLPTTFGASLPPENINSLNDRGFELQLGTSGSKQDFSWDVSGNISWSRAKWDHYEEPEYTDPDQERIYKHSGRWTDRQFGYVSEGLFTSQQQIDALQFDEDNQGNVSLRPGDIQYKDLNGDGKLDWKDQIQVGKGTVPHWMFGFNINLKYRDFDLSTLFQGAFGFYDYVVLTHGTLPPAIVYDLRWTEENNNPNALVPRLGGASTNGLTSDYYYKKAGYMRLKVLSIGYNLPQHLLENIKLSQVRFYFAGNNLLTFDKMKKYDLDPEAPSGNAAYYYPQQKTMSFGVNITF